MRIAVTGTKGQLARALLERAGGAEIVLLGRPDLDLEELATMRPALAAARPDIVVNAAAYTAVDQAESEPEAAHAVNALAAGEVAAAARALGAPVIQISTDYVFDGSCERPYREDDPVAPLGIYGASKLAGEQAVVAAQPDHVVLRTAWVYSPFGKNFVRTMLMLGETRQEVTVVADQRGCPTAALDLADAILAVAGRLVGERDNADLRGTFHAVGGGETTWAGFAEAIFADAARLGRPGVRVRPIMSQDYPTPARRPANSRLDCAKLQRIYGLSLPPWRSTLPGCVARLIRPGEPA
jgi:dTDP-4-dehydrorhamnose reductase